MKESWLSLMIGNSRLHWAWFVSGTLKHAWNTNHLAAKDVEQLTEYWVSSVIPDEILPLLSSFSKSSSFTQIPVYMASVVPAQTELLQRYFFNKVITLEQIPLLGLYPTLGIDRALAVLGAGETFRYPVLVIDAGTALTFTGADAHRELMGGAILPGLGLQLQSLAKSTAALPAIQLPPQLPPRWAKQTKAAIESGVIYMVMAGLRDFIEDWRYQFPDSQIALTGGDSHVLLTYLQVQFPKVASQLIVDPHLIFWGIRSVVQGLSNV